MKVGVVGIGAIFEFFYLDYLVKEKYDVYIDDLDESQLTKFQHSYGFERWQGQDVDIALILVPPKHHCAEVLKRINLSTKLIVEKPLVRTVEELALLEPYSNKIYVNNTRRLFPVNKVIKQLVSERKVKHVSYYEGGKMEWPMKSAAYFTNGRGILEDRGSHVIDLINLWLNEDWLEKFEILSTNKVDGVEGQISLRMSTVLGVDCLVALNWYEKSANIYRIIFDNGEILEGDIYDWNTVKLISTKGSKLFSAKKLNDTFNSLVKDLFRSVKNDDSLLSMEEIKKSIILIDQIYKEI